MWCVRMDLNNILLIFMCMGCVTISMQSPVSENTSEIPTNDRESNLSFVHHDYQSMEIYLNELHGMYPNITRLYSIGKSVEGRELYVMEITTNPGKHDVNKPEVKYIGNIHGNEVTGKEMLLQLMKVLCTQYGIDEQITNIVNTIRLHILPSMNPDGYEVARKFAMKYPHFDSVLYSRKNNENVDLNRNFPRADEECMSLFNREPETQAIMKWTAEIPFVLSLDLHGGTVAVVHPYGFKKERTPDEAVFQALAHTFVDNNLPMQTLVCHAELCSYEYIIGTASDFYSGQVISGDMQDYDYSCGNCFTVSVEMNVIKYPKADNLAGLWRENKESLLAFVVMSRKGIHGFVHSCNGHPIPRANITIEGNAKNIVTAENGDYWRMMVPGDYNVTASHTGYESVTQFVHIPSVNASSSETVILNFTLSRKRESTWSSHYDFGLLSNLNKRYLNNSELYDRFDELKYKYPNSFIRSDNGTDDRLRHGWKITGDMTIEKDDKFHIALIGGVRASQLIGPEILLRLATHLLSGKENNDSQITNFLDKVVLHIIPWLYPGFENVEYKYNASKSNGMEGTNLMNENITDDTDLIAREFQRTLETTSYDAVISIIGGGMGTAYTNEFFEVFKDIADEYDRSMQKDICRSATVSKNFINFIHDKHDIPGITLALSCYNYPSADSIPIIWQDNLLPMKRLLFRLAHGIIIRVHDENENIIDNSRIHFSREVWKKPFHSMLQKSRVFRAILPQGPVAIQITHLQSMSSFVSEESYTGILRTNVTVLNV